MSARKRAQERERAPLPPAFDPFAAFPASPFPGMTSQPFSSGAPEPSGGPGKWQSSSLFDSEQLPDWLRPSTSEPERRAGAAGQGFQPRAGNDPFAQRPNQGALPTSGPLNGAPPVNPMAPAPRPPMNSSPNSSPYRAGGRNAGEDPFAASSLLDQNKLPEWLRSRQERPQPSGPSSTGGKSPPASEFRPASPPGADPFSASSVNEGLPEWLRAMDPGAPPPTMSSRFGTASLRPPPGPAGSFGANRSPNQERRDFPERPAPSADPFGGNQGGSLGFPSRDPFGSNRPMPGSFGAPPAGSADPFAGRSSLGQSFESRPRPFGSPGPQGGAFPGMPQPEASPFGSASSLGNSPFAGTSGPRSGGGPASGSPFDASGSPFNRQREPGGSPFGAAPAPGASLYAPSSGAPPFSMPSAFDALAPRSAPLGRAPGSREPAAPSGERFAPGAPLENANLPDWLRIPDGEHRSARPSEMPSSAPLYMPAETAAPPSSAPLYRPGERISPFAPAAPAADAQQAMPGSAQAYASFGATSAPSAFSAQTPPPFEAASLIDEESLPGWLSGSSQTEPLPLPITVAESVTGSKPRQEASERTSAGGDAGNQGAGRGAEHEEDLPDWLRQVYSDASVPALENQPAASAGERPAPTMLSAPSVTPQAEVSNVFNASDLLDQHAVPNWLREASETSPLASVEGTAPAARTKGGADAQASGMAPLSANSLLDEASLPEWLRNIEADGPPAPFNSPRPTTGGLPAGTTSGIFSAAELIDTQSLPAWLQTESGKAAAPGAAQPPAASATPATGSPFGSISNVFSAAELVDTQALPAWLKANGEGSGSAGSASAAPEGPAVGSGSGVFSPAELIDTHALPAWLKAEGQGAEGEKAASASSSGVFSAAELVDTQALPAWLKQEGSAPTPSTPVGDGRSESLSKLSPLPTGFVKQQTGSFSAAELVDTQALPAWLKGAADPAVSLPPTSPVRSGPLSPPEGERFSAAELIDTQALPTWMKNSEEGSPLSPSGLANAPQSGEGNSFSAPGLIDPQALPAWLKEGSAEEGQQAPRFSASSQPAQPRDPESPGTGTLIGASLIDKSELPGWLQGPGSFERPGAHVPENEGGDTPQARVPRRPRISTEANRAPSQAAASVFSSVLGPAAGEEPAQGSSSGRGTQQASRAGGPQRDQAGRSPGAKKGGEPAGRAPSADSAEDGGWESYVPDRSSAGERSGVRRMPPPAPEDMQEWGAPPGRRSSTTRQAFGRSGGSAAREQGTGGPAPQWRELPRPDAPQGARQRFEDAGWEGGPEMPPGYAEDEDIGPPSGVFAKIKRVLGFKR
ncbi:MAG TPA: hypothetical protein VH540_03690 [Ktedonobacterales bacterium]